jgi:hypothetical protein
MFATNQLHTIEKHSVKSATLRLCAGYWMGFNANANTPEQDPIKMASFFKGFGN